MYSVQKYDREKKAWKTLYISSRKETSTGLMTELIKVHPGIRYRIVGEKAVEPYVKYSEVINRKDNIEEILLRH